MKKEPKTLCRVDSPQLLQSFSPKKHLKKDKPVIPLSRKRNFADYKNTYPPYLHIFFSIPEGATHAQVCDVIGMWLDEHPAEWNKPSYQLLIKALKTHISGR